MIESTSEIVAKIAALTKAITETHHGKALDYDEVQARLITIVSDHPIQNNNLLTSLDTLAAINGTLLSWLKSHLSCVSKHDLKETEERLLKAINADRIHASEISPITHRVRRKISALKKALGQQQPN